MLTDKEKLIYHSLLGMFNSYLADGLISFKYSSTNLCTYFKVKQKYNHDRYLTNYLNLELLTYCQEHNHDFTSHPFNHSYNDYVYEIDNNMCHLNMARLYFVKSQIKKLTTLLKE